MGDKIAMHVRNSVALVLVSIALSGCGDDNGGLLQGYVEGEMLFVSSPVAGTLTQLKVERGDQVQVGDEIFILEPEPEKSAVAAAQARLELAEAELADLRKGSREEELEIIKAQYDQAKAAANLSQQQLQRAQSLVKKNLASQEALDEAVTQARSDNKRVEEIEAQLKTAQLSARSDRLLGAEAQVRAAQAEVDQAQWRLAEKTQRAPKVAIVQDILFRSGEFVGAGQPVVAMLPPEQIRIRFFVPEPRLQSVSLGQPVKIQCDNCAQPIPATISFIASQAEYTPPFIYSKENRAKFVFLIEAVPDDAFIEQLRPGQPVDVVISPSA